MVCVFQEIYWEGACIISFHEIFLPHVDADMNIFIQFGFIRKKRRLRLDFQRKNRNVRFFVLRKIALAVVVWQWLTR